jgi:sulfate adenylyltransferase subunit 1
MVTAASTAQLAIVLVDARHGIIKQTRRHATLANLLGIPHLIVAINKMDLVDFREDAYARIVTDFRAFAARAGIDDAKVRFVPMSALAGDMVVDRGDRLDWYSGPTLLEILEAAPLAAAAPRTSLRLPVQYVARPAVGAGRSYQGRVEAGTVVVGQAVTVLPSGRTSTVREIRRYPDSVTEGRLHDPVAITLADEIDISRGDMLVSTIDSPVAVREVQATLCWFDERPLDRRRTYLLRHTTREVRARIDTIDHLWNVTTQTREPAPDALAMNDIGDVALTLAQPIVADRYDDNHVTGSFILIDEATNATAAAGLIR